MSQTIKMKLVLRDHLKTEEKLPRDTYYEDIADGLLVVLICGFIGGILWTFVTGGLEVLAMWILAGCFFSLIGLCVWNMADLFIERNEP